MELGFGAIIIIIILVLLGNVLGQLSRLSGTINGLLRLLHALGGMEKDDLRIRETPKSVSAMTSLELPRIEKDFPEFHWPEWKQRCENIMKMYLEAVEHREPHMLKDVGYGMSEQVRLAIEENREHEVKEAFDNTKIHQTEITRYERDKYLCRVLVQMSVEYLHSIEGPEIEKPLVNEKEQHRFEIELVYVQDITALGEQSMGFGVNCPNCGAPITNLGKKYCGYCGSAVEPVNIRVWTPNKIKELC